ncbi:MAG: hypothetical protein GF416_03685 [Candidatus Altiarchaeales archaeon]|nr:hypothetical protein [Candidatus Altiarchaeales archaeon]MBD3416221.1 hypothetical protein [Candidatus Altiarchaeales archaeon]
MFEMDDNSGNQVEAEELGEIDPKSISDTLGSDPLFGDPGMNAALFKMITEMIPELKNSDLAHPPDSAQAVAVADRIWASLGRIKLDTAASAYLEQTLGRKPTEEELKRGLYIYLKNIMR